MSIINISKNIGMQQNLVLRVLDATTHEVVQQHVSHNTATNTLLTGIGHYLVGDGILNQGYNVLREFIPRYISLGTMGLINQEEDAEGLPAGIGASIPNSDDPEYQEKLQRYLEAKENLQRLEALVTKANCCDFCQTCPSYLDGRCPVITIKNDYEAAKQELEDALNDLANSSDEEARFNEYMNQRPGYGADGYDSNCNNGRKWFGLGYCYESYDPSKVYTVEDVVTYKGIVYSCNSDNVTGSFDSTKWNKLPEQPGDGRTVNLELVSLSYPRSEISFRDIVPEVEAELPKTIDVVFSALVSVGALREFRESGKDYIFITEAGLWSTRNWNDSGQNGLLAGYRIVPTDEEHWDMSDPENRKILKQSILRVGYNQVVQVIWKIQIGSIDQLAARSETFGD